MNIDQIALEWAGKQVCKVSSGGLLDLGNLERFKV